MLNINCGRDQLPQIIKLMFGIDLDIDVGIKFYSADSENELSKLGSVKIKTIKIDYDGESKIQLMTSIDFVELELLNALVEHSEEEIEFYLKYELEGE